MDEKPPAVIPDNLSEMSPQEAWNLALNTIAPLADWNSFWNDGRDTGEDINNLIIKIKERTDERPRFRYRNSPRRFFGRSQGLYSWRFRHADFSADEAQAQREIDSSSKSNKEVIPIWQDLAGR